MNGRDLNSANDVRAVAWGRPPTPRGSESQTLDSSVVTQILLIGEKSLCIDHEH